MLYRAHRGVLGNFPENTMAAFRDALAHGIAQIETDPRLTKDGVIVLVHDETVNRTFRYADGSPISVPLRVSDLTYAELMQLDAGNGEKICRLDELLALAAETETSISLDKKIETAQMGPLLDLVAQYDTNVSFSVQDLDRIRLIQSRFPNAVIDYDGNTTEAELEAVLSLVKWENLFVWMYLDRPNFAWLKDRMKTSPENCARVKRYARLGIGNVNHTYDVMDALAFEPDVIEV